MKPDTIRILDRLLGVPICFLLTLVRCLESILPHTIQPASSKPKKILFIKMIEQGATVLAYRALSRAVELVGRENVYFWVFEENRPILDILSIIPSENIFAIRSKSLGTLILDFLVTLRHIRRIGIDATVDMEFFARSSAIFAFLSGASRRVGMHRFTSEGPYRGNLLSHRIQFNPYLHTASTYLLLVEALLADSKETPLLKTLPPDTDLAPPLFVPTPSEREEILKLLKERAGYAGIGPLVLLNPNASDLLPLRKWPVENYAELGKLILHERPDVTLVITGAASERNGAEILAKTINSPQAVSLAGFGSLRQLMTLYTVADVMVTNDSGPGHFSSLTNIDAIVLFGPETPTLFGPLGRYSHAIRVPLACSPCVNATNHRASPCTNNICMQRITVDQVYHLVNTLLAERRTRNP